MPLRLDIKRQLSASSERVKCCDMHPQEPWILSALFSGHVFIWNHQTGAHVKTFEVSDLPVRAAKFIPSKQWVVCGSDDLQIRVFNYNTMERVHQFEAHADYIRSLAVHPTLPLLLSSSDDMFIRLWNWEKGWECQQVFEGHTHYVMQVEFNPKDNNTFASASLDRTVKVWGLNSQQPHFSLEGHERGVNCVSYFRGGDRPYLVSGADDHLVKVWDYQTKSCVATLDGHTNNVSAVAFHPQLPVIVTGSEDGTARVWHSSTYRLENTLNYGMGRVWSVACLEGSNGVAVGYDDGTIMVKLGQEEPVVSMESGGKIVWARNSEVVTANVKKLSGDEVADGEPIDLAAKEMGSCEVYPQSMQHSPNGRLVAVCGDGEYIIYTALALRNKSFGHALEFVWSQFNGVYATRESTSRVTVFKNFETHKQFRPAFSAEGVFGGHLLGVRSSDFVDLYDWDECRIVRRIDVCPHKVFWSESGEVLVLACEDSFFVLRYNRDLVSRFFDQGIETDEQGVEGSLELEQEVGERVLTGHFVGDCFIYTNAQGRLNYYVGGETITLAHLDRPMYMLGYLPKQNRVYVMDKAYSLHSYELLVSVLVFQTAIVREDYEGARAALADVPREHHNRVAHFLEAQGLREMALEVSHDAEHRFELALALEDLEAARGVLLEDESPVKWKQLGDLALAGGRDLALAEECYSRSGDLGSLLLVYSSLSDAEGMARLAEMARAGGLVNVAFICLFLLGRVNDCVDLLCETGRVPEAAFLARTYAPSQVSRVLALWKEDLKSVSERASESLADPALYPELFPNLELGAAAEVWQSRNAKSTLPATAYLAVRGELGRDLVAAAAAGELQDYADAGFAVAKPQPKAEPAVQESAAVAAKEEREEEVVAQEDEEEEEEEAARAVDEPAAATSDLGLAAFAAEPAAPAPEPAYAQPEPEPADDDFFGGAAPVPAADEAAAQPDLMDLAAGSVGVDDGFGHGGGGGASDLMDMAAGSVEVNGDEPVASPGPSAGDDFAVLEAPEPAPEPEPEAAAPAAATGGAGPSLEELNASLEALGDDDWDNF